MKFVEIVSIAVCMVASFVMSNDDGYTRTVFEIGATKLSGTGYQNIADTVSSVLSAIKAYIHSEFIKHIIFTVQISSRGGYGKWRISYVQSNGIEIHGRWTFRVRIEGEFVIAALTVGYILWIAHVYKSQYLNYLATLLRLTSTPREYLFKNYVVGSATWQKVGLYGPESLKIWAWWRRIIIFRHRNYGIKIRFTP